VAVLAASMADGLMTTKLDVDSLYRSVVNDAILAQTLTWGVDKAPA